MERKGIVLLSLFVGSAAVVLAFCYGLYLLACSFIPSGYWQWLSLNLEKDWLFFAIFVWPFIILAGYDCHFFFKARKRLSLDPLFWLSPLILGGLFTFSYLMILFYSLNHWIAGLLLAAAITSILSHRKSERAKDYIALLDRFERQGPYKPGTPSN